MTEPKQNKPAQRSLFIESRSWLDQYSGNSYYSLRLWVDGAVVMQVGRNLGYDTAFEYAGINYLVARGYLSREFENKPPHVVRQITRLDIYTINTFGNKRDQFKDWEI